MPQFYVPAKNRSGNALYFEPEESHHLSRVLKKQSGDVVQVFDGEGWVAPVRITGTFNAQRVEAVVLAEKILLKSPLTLALYPALIKGERFDWLLEKATELGVDSIHPMFTERTVVRVEGANLESKLERWQKIILAAAKQCGRQNLPKLHAPLPFAQCAQTLAPDRTHFILWETEELKRLSTQFNLNPKMTHCSLFIGPEGGFTLREAQLAASCGAVAVRLGESILRAETAALVGASYLLMAATAGNA